MTTRQLTMAEAINEAIRHEMRRDSNIVLLGQDIGVYGGTFGVYKGLFDEFGPERVRDGPLCEAATAGFGIGLALAGMPAIVEIEFIDFMTLASDAVVNQAAKMRYFFGGQVQVPLVVRTPIVNRLGLGAQHSQSLEAWLMHVPGLRVVVPSNATDAKGLMLTAIRDGNPVVFIEHVRLYSGKSPVEEADEPIPFGKLRVAREGTDVTIATYSGMVKPCLEAAEKLAAEGIECEVLDLRTLAPLDREGICTAVKRTGRLVVAHEAVKTGGVGAEVAQTALEGAFDYLQAPILRVAARDLPIPTGKLQDVVFPGSADVEDAVRKVME
ncbi:MAG TPA: alpha-ketoacid dehydrogenase subunit beta [Abditibacteriaceae bacterium]|nr:alpha-ketoacid dehydrogenase subunit beta [Abditibacteriaceae bacterium]